MRMRDITKDEVLAAINCPCNHQQRKDGRWEVNHPAGTWVIKAIYRRGSTARYVINVMKERRGR